MKFSIGIFFISLIVLTLIISLGVYTIDRDIIASLGVALLVAMPTSLIVWNFAKGFEEESK